MTQTPQELQGSSKGPRWWQRRNALGVSNWEWVLILFAAVAAGIVVTVGTSLLGVR